MTKIKGVCKNIDACFKAETGEIQEVDRTSKFECEECHKPLQEVPGNKSKGGGKKGLPPWVFAIIAVVVLGGSGLGAFFMLSGKNKQDDGGAAGEPVKIQSIQLLPASISLKTGESGDLRIELIPENADRSSLQWTSSNPSVATVNETGFIKAVSEGTAVIRVSDKKGDAKAESSVQITNPDTIIDPPTKGGDPQPTKRRLQFDFGVYEGDIVNGKAHGTGELVYTKAHRISRNDEKERIAQPGEKISGIFANNEPTTVKWYNKEGSLKESIIIGSSGLQ